MEETQIVAIGQIINQTIEDSLVNSYSCLSTIIRETNNRLKEEGQNTQFWELSILSKVCSMMLVHNSNNDPFQPYMILDGKRSYSMEDIGSKELHFFSNLITHVINPPLKARLADLLWMLETPRNPVYVKTAIENYLLIEPTPENWRTFAKDCWYRSINLARRTRNKKAINNIEAKLFDEFIQAELCNDFYKLDLAELIVNYKLLVNKHTEVANELQACASNLIDDKQYAYARDYLKLPIYLYKRLKQKDLEVECTFLRALAFEKEATFNLENSLPDQLIANSLYEQALQAYREIPKDFRAKYDVESKLLKISDGISETGLSALKEMGTVKIPGLDLAGIEEIAREARRQVKGEECLELAVILFTRFPVCSYAHCVTELKKSLERNFFSRFYGSIHFSKDGRVTSKNSATGLAEGEKDSFYHKTVEWFTNLASFMVEAEIMPALHQLLEEHRVSRSYLLAIIQHSPIIPSDRQYQLLDGLWQGFEFNFSTAVYVLCPQLENIVRIQLKQAGIKTTTINTQGIENELGMSTLLDRPESVDVFGEDTLFHLQSLFTDASGFNLRNECAHGLLDDNNANSYKAVYSWWFILRMIVNSVYKK